MKPPFLTITCITFAALLAGCDSKSGSSGESPASMPKTEKALATAADETKKAVSEAAASVAASAKTAAADITSKFLSVAKVQGDAVLSSLGQDLAAKAKSLVESCGANEGVSTNLDASLSALANGKDAEALEPAFQVAQAMGLTPTQAQLAQEVGNLTSAFVVQRNFSSLSGAQGDVAALVNSLRNGQYSATLQPLQKIYTNASLTPEQKQLIGSVVDQYAPSLKKAAGSMQEGLKQFQGLPGVSK